MLTTSHNIPQIFCCTHASWLCCIVVMQMTMPLAHVWQHCGHVGLRMRTSQMQSSFWHALTSSFAYMRAQTEATACCSTQRCCLTCCGVISKVTQQQQQTGIRPQPCNLHQAHPCYSLFDYTLHIPAWSGLVFDIFAEQRRLCPLPRDGQCSACH